MGSIYELIRNEMPQMLSGAIEHIWMIILWMISGIIALLSGLNYKEFFVRSNFDLLLLVFMLPFCVLFYDIQAAMIIIAIYFTGRLMLRFADKEQDMNIQFPMWVLIIAFVIGLGFAGFNIYQSPANENVVEYSIEVQDSIMLGEMPYEVKKDQENKVLQPGPLAYYISYIPNLISPLTVEVNNETHYLTNFSDAKLAEFNVPKPTDRKLITLNDLKSNVEKELKVEYDPSELVDPMVQLQTTEAVSYMSMTRINANGAKILEIFALLVLLAGLFFSTKKLASAKLAMFLMILVIFLPWKTLLIGSTWNVFAVGIFLFAVFSIKITWLSGILFGLAVGINPILLVTLPLFINYYMPNIPNKGYWLISLGIMILGLVITLFGPSFETEAFNFMPMEFLGAILIFIGLALSFIFSFLGNSLKRAPGAFFFAFLVMVFISFVVVILYSHENSITDSVTIFAKGVLASSLITGAGALKVVAIPLLGLLILFHFLPRNIAQGGLIVLSSALVMFAILLLEIPMNGSEFLLLIPALFISHLKGSMLAEDKLTTIRLKEQVDAKTFDKPEDKKESFADQKLYGISDFGKGEDKEADDDVHVFTNSPFDLDDDGEVIGNVKADDFYKKHFENDAKPETQFQGRFGAQFEDQFEEQFGDQFGDQLGDQLGDNAESDDVFANFGDEFDEKDDSDPMSDMAKDVMEQRSIEEDDKEK